MNQGIYTLDPKSMLLQDGKDITYDKNIKDEILRKNSELSERYYKIRKILKPKLIRKKEKGVLNEKEQKLLNDYLREEYKIREEIIRNNGGLIKSIVNQESRNNNDVYDLIQSGLLGLLKALDKYDIKKSNNFSNYAYFWIKSEIRSSICMQENIRIPNSTWAMKNKLEKMDKAGLATEDDKKRLKRLKKNIDMVGNGSVSLSNTLGNEDKGEGRELTEVLADPESLDIDYNVSQKMEINRITNAIFGLYQNFENSNKKVNQTKKKALAALLLEYGLDHFKKEGMLSDRTLVEVATIFFFSPLANKIYKRERIRQFRKMAIEELYKHIKDSNTLKNLTAK